MSCIAMTGEPDVNNLPTSPQDLQQRLLQGIATSLEDDLKGVLAFASVAEVSALICHLLRFADASIEVLTEELPAVPTASAAFESWLAEKAENLAQQSASTQSVQDCDRVAEFLNKDSSEATRRGIRDHYWLGLFRWIEIKLRAKFRIRGIDKPSDEDLAAARDHVFTSVFHLDSFERILAQYQPSEGREFANFLKHYLDWRCTDAADRAIDRAPPDEVSEVEDITEMADIPEPVSELTPEEVHDLLGALAAKLERQADGTKKRAVFELRFKLYFNPEVISPATLLMVQCHSSSGVERLARDYQEIQDNYSKLQTRLQELHGDWVKALAKQGKLRYYLETEGYNSEKLDQLQSRAAYLSTIEELVQEQKKANDAGESKRWLELAYMIACKRRDNATKSREKSLAEWRKFKAFPFPLPWVRSTPEIGDLTGLSQPTVYRLLESALEYLSGFESPGPSGGE